MPIQVVHHMAMSADSHTFWWYTDTGNIKVSLIDKVMFNPHKGEHSWLHQLNHKMSAIKSVVHRFLSYFPSSYGLLEHHIV